MTAGEIAAALWWRWEAGLTVVDPVTGWRSLCVLSEGPDGARNVPEALTYEGVRDLPEGAIPDLADPHLPGWLLHLLRERTGPGTHAHPDVVAGGGWDVWVDRAEPGSSAVWRCIGSGDTELDALLAALQGVGS